MANEAASASSLNSNRRSTFKLDAGDCSSANDSRSNFEGQTGNYKTASEYAKAVNVWLWQCYYWQWWSAYLPYSLLAQAHNQPGFNATDVNKNLPSLYFPNQNFFVLRQQDSSRSGISDGSQNASAGRNIQLQPSAEYLLPSLWKRFAAETIDFFIFLVLKVIATYIAVDIFEIVDLDKFDFEFYKDDHFIYRTALEMTSELVILESIHRFLVCAIEAICLHRGTQAPGGATPGKSIMRLRVVSCTQVISLENNRLRVHPAQDIGIGWALLRCFIKNFSLAFFLPACSTIFFFQHNRTAYDMICNCIVVEDLPQQPIHQPLPQQARRQN